MGALKTATAKLLHVPNEKTVCAIENVRRGKGKRFDNPEKLFEDLGI